MPLLYFDTIPEIAARFGMTGNHVSVTLSRLRLKLRKHLSERALNCEKSRVL